MAIGDQLLYSMAWTWRWLEAKRAARTSRDSVGGATRSDPSKRVEDIRRILSAARKHNVAIEGRDVLDFGCNDGSVTVGYVEAGAKSVTGVDIDAGAIERAQGVRGLERVRFLVCSSQLPVPTSSIDSVLSFDVFEHVINVEAALAEIHRVLRPGGKALIGVCGGWHHPYAPHLRAVMPVPWAHVLFAEKTLLAACRKVYWSSWYKTQSYDFDSQGRRKNHYASDSLDPNYLNRFLIRDFERVLQTTDFDVRVHLVPFGSAIGRWLLSQRSLRELVTGYLWIELQRRPA